MIQRVQSLYLLGVIACLVPAIYCEIIDWAIKIMCLASLGGAFVATEMTLLCLFAYKNRKKQLLFTKVIATSMLLMILLRVASALFIPESYSTSLLLYIVPLCIGLLFTLLAARGIRKDEELVRAAYRVR